MLDPNWNVTGGGFSLGIDFSHSDKGCFISNPRPPQFSQSSLKRNTVKELLMMQRQVQQKWSCPQDDDVPEHRLKCAKYDVYPSDTSPPQIAHHPPPPPLDPRSFPGVFPPDPPAHQDTQPRALQAAVGDVKVSLFHWQIHRESQRVGGLSAEQLNMQDADGDTFLHIAVAQGRRALSYVLAAKMSQCGSLDMKEHNGQTALQIAAATNQHHLVQDLLTHGAQVNSRDVWGGSPLHVCAEKGHLLSLQSIWRTLLNGLEVIDIEMFNYEGLTPLHVAVLSHNAVVRELRCLQSPCSYMEKQLLQRRQTHYECVRTLLLMGASYGTRDLKSGRTCLHMAAEEANVDLLSLFLDQPSSLSTVNMKTFSGNTVLHIVSSLQQHRRQVEAVKLLMRRGADPGIRNYENELPSQLVPPGAAGEKVRLILKGKHSQA